MYTEDELKAIKEAERRIDMVRDADHKQQYAEYKKARAAAIEARREQQRQQNPELEARLAAIRERQARENGD